MVSLLFFFDGVPAMFGLIAMIQQCLREEGRFASTTAKSCDHIYNNLHMGGYYTVSQESLVGESLVN